MAVDHNGKFIDRVLRNIVGLVEANEGIVGRF